MRRRGKERGGEKEERRGEGRGGSEDGSRERREGARKRGGEGGGKEVPSHAFRRSMYACCTAG